MPKNTYTAEQIQVLEGLEPVRKRPGMYIGSTDSRGLHECLREIVDNSVDESFAGTATEIWVRLSKDGSAMVRDNGRGVPVDIHKSGVSALELAMTKLHAGGKFGGGAYKISGGLHGVGASVVNALSSYFMVVVLRDGKAYLQEYNEGKPKRKVREITQEDLDKLIPPQWGIKLGGNLTGTITKFFPDKKIFERATLDDSKVKTLLRDRAYLVAGLSFHFEDERNGETANFYFEGGIKSLVAHANREKEKVSDVVYLQKEDGIMQVEVALQYTDSFNENVKGYVNGIYTVDGGTHVTGFRIALTRSITDYGRKNGYFKDEKTVLTGDDLKEGLTAVVYVKMPSESLQFESQTKAKLNNPEVQGFVSSAVKEGLDTYLEEHPQDARKILEKVLLAAKARMAARAAKDAVIRKGALEGASLPGKLADCQSTDPEVSEIFIVEGDSAGGCWDGKTEVALADGRNLSFIDLIEEEKQGKQNYCYTILDNSHIGLAPILNPRLTRRKVQVIKITLDNGEILKCTPDHLFRLVDGRYVPAISLTRKQNLSPLYRKITSKIDQTPLKGYEQVFDPKYKKWIYTHLLADFYNLKNKVYKSSDGRYRHHVDFNKLNNNPTNLVRISKEEHMAIHYAHLEKTLHRPDSKRKSIETKRTAEFREKARIKSLKMSALFSKNAKKQWSDPKYKEFMINAYMKFYKSHAGYRKRMFTILNDSQKKYWGVETNRKVQSERVRHFFESHPERKQALSEEAKKQWSDQSLIQWRSKKTSEQWTSEFRQKRKVAYNQTYYLYSLRFLKQILENGGNIEDYENERTKKRNTNLLKLQTLADRFFQGDFGKVYETALHFNHKIVKVEKCAKKLDVYDIEVPGTHNFALAAGVFVHNSARQGRDRKFQAILPLFGKVLNTERARIDQIVTSDKFKSFIIALGAGIGDQFDVKKLRYHRIIILADADVDGSHIKCLHLTFLYRHLKPLVEKGYVYVALPPLYKVEWAKNTKYIYSDEEKDVLVKSLNGSKINIQRYKGLGEMNATELWETTMNPKTRILKQININDAEAADRMFTMLMGEEVEPRKKYIQTFAKTANLDI